MFFQGLLVLGYALGWLAGARSATVLLYPPLAAAAIIRLLHAPAAQATGGGILPLLASLAVSVGPAFLALSSATPFVQDRYRASRGKDPAFLYSWSNAGAFVGLLSYPLLVEPFIPLPVQYLALACGLAVYALLLAFLPAAIRRDEPAPIFASSKGSEPLWLLLALGPSAALLAATNLLGIETAAAPLIWVLPLGAYLLTMVLAFRSRPWFPRHPAWLLIGAGLILLAGTAGTLDALGHWREAWFMQRRLLLGAKAALIQMVLFMICLACHRALAESRPEPRALPRFYLAVAVGGWLGALLVSLLLPWACGRLASPNFEALTALIFCAAGLSAAERERRPGRAAAYGAALAGLLLCAAWAAAPSAKVLFRLRDFYGFYRVTENAGLRLLYHGRTVHGMQFLEPKLSSLPVAYYHPHSPVGEVFEGFGAEAKSVGVVGLGAGALAAYGRPGQAFDFFELDGELAGVAKAYFGYLNASPARIEVFSGDARLSLARPGRRYDILILDAFVGGAIPLHLLTDEAFAVYERRLTPNGLVLAHVTNRFLDLRPPLAALVRERGWTALAKRSNANGVIKGQELVSSWVVLAPPDAKLERLTLRGWSDISPLAAARPWTDALSSVWSALR
jgi:hypothetical protein